MSQDIGDESALEDDHSRLAVASHVDWGETAKDAIVVFDKAVAAHGVPQHLLSDNGLALNPSRRGIIGQLVAHVGNLSVEAITGKPYKPTTQGKNERFYNTQRPHHELPGRVTPQTAWEATPQADPPRPKPDRPIYEPPAPVRQPRPKLRGDLPADTRIRTVATTGNIAVDRVFYEIDVDHAFKHVLVITDDDQITVTDLDDEILAEHTRPAPGFTYVGNGRPPGPRPRKPRLSPMSCHTNRQASVLNKASLRRLC